MFWLGFLGKVFKLQYIGVKRFIGHKPSLEGLKKGLLGTLLGGEFGVP